MITSRNTFNSGRFSEWLAFSSPQRIAERLRDRRLFGGVEFGEAVDGDALERVQRLRASVHARRRTRHERAPQRFAESASVRVASREAQEAHQTAVILRVKASTVRRNRGTSIDASRRTAI